MAEPVRTQQGRTSDATRLQEQPAMRQGRGRVGRGQGWGEGRARAGAGEGGARAGGPAANLVHSRRHGWPGSHALVAATPPPIRQRPEASRCWSPNSKVHRLLQAREMKKTGHVKAQEAESLYVCHSWQVHFTMGKSQEKRCLSPPRRLPGRDQSRWHRFPTPKVTSLWRTVMLS